MEGISFWASLETKMQNIPGSFELEYYDPEMERLAIQEDWK